MTHGNADEWLDDELREVPLPEQLTARLRRIAAQGADEELDARVRDVPLPAGACARFGEAVLDARCDERLCAVPLPLGWSGRLRDALAEEQLDERVRSVPLPSGWADRLHAAVAQACEEEGRRATQRIAAGPRKATRLGRWAAAASLFFAIAGSYFIAAVVLIVSAYQVGPTALVQMREDEPLRRGESFDGDLEILVRMPAHAPAALPALADDRAGGSLFGSLRLPWGPPTQGLLEELLRRMLDGRFDGFGPRLGGDAVYGSPGAAVPDGMPAPMLLASREPRGMPTPLVRGYDREFFVSTGVHPLVDCGQDERLLAVEVPLATGTESFDRLLWQLSRGETPDVRAERVRPEDFLAAMNYQFAPADDGQLAVRTAAGPSPFAIGKRLVQIGVQAGRLRDAPRPATHLVVAVDLSSPMAWYGRLDAVRRALDELIGEMQADDRLSIVVFGDRTGDVVHRASRDDAARVRGAIERLAADGGSNLPAGIRHALVLAQRRRFDDAAARVVVLTDAPLDLDPDRVRRGEAFVAAGASMGIETTIVDLSRQIEPSAALRHLAEAGRRELFRARTAADVRWILLEALTGRSPVVAADARLVVRFNPQAVAAYRLIGHEAASIFESAGAPATLRAEEAATALFEVVLHNNNENLVATAELSWTDPATGRAQQVRQPVSRLQMATSWFDSPMSLQAAALAAETAEVLRGSPHVGPARLTLDRVRELAASAHRSLRDQAEFRRLVTLVELARASGLDRATPVSRPR